MPLLIRNTAAPSLAINFNGLGVALTVQDVPAAGPSAAQNVSLTFGWETYFKRISCSGTRAPPPLPQMPPLALPSIQPSPRVTQSVL